MARNQRRARSQRAHKPHQLGPRLFQNRQGYWAADLRPWGGGRVTLLDPAHARWPREGEPTEDEDTARRWSWRYVEAAGREMEKRAAGPKGMTVGEAADAYLRHLERTHVALNTRKGAATVLRHLRNWVSDRPPVVEVGARDVQGMMDAFAAEGYAPNTIGTYTAALGPFFEWVGVDPSPTRDLALPDIPAADARAWEEEELERLRRAADEIDAEGSPFPMRLAVELALATGGRRREIAALRWELISEAKVSVRFRAQVDDEGAGLLPLKSKKNRTAFVLPSWWQYHRAARGVILPVGDRYSKEWEQTRAMEKLLARAAISEAKLGWHTFRHTYSKHCLEMGLSLEQLQKFLGHSSIQTTQQTYEHLSDEMAVDLARRKVYGEPGALRVVR